MRSKRELTVFVLAMINVAAICNLKNFPITAQLGLSVILYYALAAVFFFIPVALISAELATGWPETGGVYLWVKKALGKNLGFLAVFLQWGNNLFWYPSILSFTAASFAYLIDPKLAENPVYISVTILVLLWGLTIINLKGMKISGWISSFGVIVGTIVPGFFIIILGVYWIFTKNPSQTPISWGAAFPSLLSTEHLALMASILLTLAGMEMPAVHAKEVKNPRKNYPRAILLSAFLIFILTTLGGLSIAFVVPLQDMNLASGAIEAFSFFFTNYNISWILPIIAVSITIGAIGMVSTWIVGPTKGLLAAAEDHSVPSIFEKRNKNGMPITLLLGQGILASLLSLMFLFMPTVSSSYWILYNITALLYLLMYLLMFISAIVLRYKYPDVDRAYKIPFKNIGMWIVASLGIFGAFIAFVLGFFPPQQIEVGNLFTYESFLIGGVVFFCALPFCIKHFSK